MSAIPNNRSILVVAAHPDDEVLGCGGAMARHASLGDDVHVVFMADGATSRSESSSSPDVRERIQQANEASRILGAHTPRFLGFPDNRMDTVALLDIVQALETVIDYIRPSVVYTHHAGDLNIDHRLTHQAVMTACRPQPLFCVREIYCFEVLSSTEWSGNSIANAFNPNCFVNIHFHLVTKMQALAAYTSELRAFPHSRSEEAVKALAAYRGASSGFFAAEAFCIERSLEG